MAPEAIEFSPNIDGRADVYGFGVLFFEALTGKLPFPGPPGLELLKRILTDTAPKVTLYRPDLPSDVVTLVACALAKDPNDRFSDMEHLIRATEDRLLPLVAASRSLTPISGIFQLPSVNPSPGAPVPVVQAVFEEEPSNLAHLNETRVLYSMASQPESGASRDGIGRMMKSQRKTGTPARRKLAFIPNPWRILNHRVAVGAVAFLIVTAWVTVPASSRDRGVEQEQPLAAIVPAALAAPPMLTPPPILPSPDPEPAAAIEEPSDSGTDSESGQVIVEQVPTVRSIRTAVSHSPVHVSQARSLQPRPQLSPAEIPEALATPRAGKLSASDF
jgi:serine/threonine protein kinase